MGTGESKSEGGGEYLRNTHHLTPARVCLYLLNSITSVCILVYN